MPKSKKDTGGFTPLTDETRYRLIYRSWGLEKTGKNHFGFTGPDPIYGLYFDPGGIEGVAEKFIRGEVDGRKREINAKFYRFRKSDEDSQEVANEIREQFNEDYQFALKNARTIQWDETEFWAVCRFAEFGRESARTREYGPLNGYYRGLLQDAYDAGVNLQLIQKVKEMYEDDKRTGTYEPTGFKEAGYIVQANLCHTWDADKGFGVQIVNCRQNMQLAGEMNYDVDFPQVAQMVFPDSSEEDWQ